MMTREEQIIKASHLYAKHQQKPFIDGAMWADEHPDLYSVTRKAVERALKNLWHDAQGDDLPPIDEEVIVLCDDGHGGYKVCFGHRPNEYVAGVSYDGKMTYSEAKTYGKGGWNIPEVKYWLDVSIPNLEEQQ